ncbi:MAG: DUF4105 domain-containing protein [Bdellovibrionales bacterium]|nr:DUF4105 domain-containing protein [Bdellovibrionales bacterium]
MGSRLFRGPILSFILGACLFACVSTPVRAEETAAATEAHLVARARELKLWNHPQWINLVHYEKNLFGGYTSQADGLEFFTAKDGPTNPEAELFATIHALFRAPTPLELIRPKAVSDPGMYEALKKLTDEFDKEARAAKYPPAIYGQKLEEKKRALLGIVPDHPLCQFPARLRFFERELGWKGEGLPKIECFRLDEFRRRVDAQSVSIVFSSFFLNNPSSTFGHSFLRINSGLWQKYGKSRNELLDTGVNFAANVTTNNPITYALFGMLGLMPGTFLTVPYYLKVREYNDHEMRDLWSYDIDLTPDEVTMLIDHIWEEQSTFYFYKYFTENCSYHMFTLLDAAAPRLGLTKRLSFYVIPSDTIRVLYRTPGAVKAVTYRPSARAQFFYRLGNLNDAEREALDKLVDTHDVAALDPALPKESAARVLDAFSDQIELVSGDDLARDGSEAQKLKQRVLVKRASLGVKSETIEVPAPDRSAPHLGHGMRRASVGFARENDRGNSVTFGYRFSMHDFLDPGVGYARNMQVDMFGAWARVLTRPNQGFRSQFEFDELNIFKLTALTPLSRYYEARSIRAELGWKKMYDRDCEAGDRRCFPLNLEFGKGWVVDPGTHETLTLYGFLGGRFNHSPHYRGSNIRLGFGPRVGAVLYLNDDLRFGAFGEYYARIWAEDDFVFKTEATLRWGFTKGFALDATARRERDVNEGLAQLHFYY